MYIHTEIDAAQPFYVLPTAVHTKERLTHHIHLRISTLTRTRLHNAHLCYKKFGIFKSLIGIVKLTCFVNQSVLLHHNFFLNICKFYGLQNI